MQAQKWIAVQQESNFRFKIMIYTSILFHVLILSGSMIFPRFFKEEPINIPVLTIVQLDQPKVRLRRPKPPAVKPIEKPTIKPEAPKLSKKPDKPVKEKPVQIKEKPDTTKIVEKIVPEYFEQSVPQMVMADMTDPRLRFWCQRVQKIIQTKWQPPRGIGILGKTRVSINFTVLRPGTITETGVENSSGNSTLDGVALNTIERVGVLPPIPPNYKDKDELTVTFHFEYIGE